MKRCPECGREYDNTMMFCLDDGAELLYGPASTDEPATAILHSAEAPTRAQILDTNETAILPNTADKSPSQAASRRNSLIAGVLGILLVTVLGVGSYLYYGRGSAKQIESIAVMPFVNESGNADVEYLSDGMTETLIRSLSQLANLQVKPRSSVFRYKGKVFEWLEKDFQMRDGYLPDITVSIPFESLRDDPRYKDLIRRMGLPE